MPERMCVICKKRDEKGNFYRFSSDIENKFFYDKEQKFQSRGFYLCKDLGCLNALSKHKKIKIEVEELMKILGENKSHSPDILKILQSMTTSPNLVFGIDENIEGIKSKKVKLIVIPKDIKENILIEFENLCETYNVKKINIAGKADLLKVFNRNLNVVGIINKRVVEGIMKKLEVTNEST